MIRFPCDRCERVLEVDDELAGRKVRCPSCEDVNTVPGPAPVVTPGTAPAAGPPASGRSADRATALGLPPDSGPEQQVLRIRSAMFRSRPMTFAGLILGSLVLVFAGIYLHGTPKQPLAGKIVAGLALAPLVVLLGWWVLTLDEALEITNKRTIQRKGLLRKQTTEVLHDHIRNVQVTQTFWGRIWGVGRLGISSSGQEGIEIVMEHLPRPERIRAIIDAYRPLG